MLADLTSLLSAVRAADRSSVRRHSVEWGRDLAVKVSVRNVSLWRRPEVREALVGALGYLTADRWSFKFVTHRRVKADPSQIPLVESPYQARVFMPFSNGLDSYAIATELLAEANPPELVLVNVRPRDRPTAWEKLAVKKDQSLPSVQVACYAVDPHRAELTYRSRPFLFDLLAGYGAAMAQPASVVIPENGQGSLGGSLVPLGSEAPHRSCHPGFTSRLSRLLQALTGEPVKFSHPALFRTKGEVLSALAEREEGATHWLKRHRSCSYDARHSSQDGKVMHCGLCGNCLLRRTSLIWAEVDDTTEYRAVDLTARTLEEAFRGKMPRNFQASLDVARNSVRAMQRLAELTSAPHRLRVESEVVALSRGLDEPIPLVREKMMHFLSQHQREWKRFLKSCGAKSWVTDLAGT
ncbi:hypothetical protein [Hydrogenophaga sp. PML113]|uniref:hypothetical protein n=1 Tax=Hydrogenophaga sp. PML113 TaxID=1899350 RepID=UPI00111313DE|nr:hypothetical protein [Hydrogenophaga sp. PML113]